MISARMPLKVRMHLGLFCAGAIVAAAGVLGFFFSFNDVASPARAAIAVHTDIPTGAYLSISGWLGGLGMMWVSRRVLRDLARGREDEIRNALARTPGGDGAGSADG